MARVLFLQDVLYEAFGPQLLSAVLKDQGHACDLVVLHEVGRRRVIGEIERFRPDILAFSISSFGYRWAVELACHVKQELDVVTVFGGPHPTFFPEFVRERGIDAVCVGEGEGAMVDLAEAIDAGAPLEGIANLAQLGPHGEVVRNPLRPLIDDLDTIPFPDRSIHFKYAPLRRLSYKRFLVGRGCPYGCTYCFNRAQWDMYRGLGKYVRHRSPGNVIEEILRVRAEYGLETVGFSDDTFTTNKQWLLSFLELYRTEVGVPFTCLTRINELDQEIVDALARAGCHYASFGLEVGNEEIRNKILNRRMSDDEIRSKARMLREAGIPFLTFNMFGVPGETAADGLRTLELNAEIRTSMLGASVFTPLLGTEIFEFCKRNGYLEDSYDVEDFDRITSRSPLKNVPDLAFLANLQKIGFIGVWRPKLLPLIKRLARLPLSPLYELAYKVSLFFRYKVRFRLSSWEVIRLGMGSRGRFG
jgi:radical SAM superfamily enzyme YgiQ (UPF0313 family)